ncbi:MAG: hypothetical protein KDB00_24800, partial [Planctomycetales bacterium]|nr:hypothetical protein [Planctomycetales bacterium]
MWCLRLGGETRQEFPAEPGIAESLDEVRYGWNPDSQLEFLLTVLIGDPVGPIRQFTVLFLIVVSIATAMTPAFGETSVATGEQLEFFEKKVRPLLVE